MNRLRFFPSSLSTRSLVAVVCLLLTVVALSAAGCRYKHETTTTTTGTEPAMSEPAPEAAPPAATEPAMGGRTAEATLASSLPGVGGTVRFTEEAGGGVRVVADVTGAKAGKHGFHIHETGDCSAPDYKSAGGHFNPTGAVHACDPTNPRHAGDFGNIEVGPNGTGHMEMVAPNLTFDGPSSLVGKAVILHAGEDDCKTQPSGNSGDRIACGVIQSH
jgi:superoxide dismutase, Cu-Zn family